MSSDTGISQGRNNGKLAYCLTICRAFFLKADVASIDLHALPNSLSQVSILSSQSP